METWLATGLSVIIAFGLTTIAAVALANIVGLRIHDRERPLYGERVEGCPCRIDFSRAACRETSAMGKSTSASRLHALGIIQRIP